MKKKALSLALAVLMMASAALTGCQKEAPIAADAMAVAMFNMYIKDDASSAMELFGYSDEAEAREELNLDDNLYGQLADQLVSQFSAMGLTVTEEDAQEFVGAFMTMFSGVSLTAKVKESDEKAGTAVVTCTVNTFDPEALTQAMTQAMTNLDPSLFTGGDLDADAAASVILKAVADVIAKIEPTDKTADFDVDFHLIDLDLNGKVRKAWVPEDSSEYGALLSTTVMGG